ncbi:MAG: acyltransferase [Puniceicoccales bacterium]|jgi:hypothetical protein|nr:acyltransferase [Puniceicoccales bacterium]
MEAEKLQSQVIAFLRFPLMAGVLLTHINFPYFENGWFFPVHSFLARIIACVGVPFFFFISGFLFFHGGHFDKDVYLRKICGRTRTLLLPYLLWTTAWLIFYYAVYQFPFTAQFLQKAEPYTLEYMAGAFWSARLFYPYNDGSGATFPLIGQFWFIRDLMVLVLLSPLIYKALQKLKVGWVVLTGIVWLFAPLLQGKFEIALGWWDIALFFFSFGAWFSVNKQLFTVAFDRLRKAVFWGYPLLVAIELLSMHHSWKYGFFIHRIGLVVGIIFFANLTALFLSRGKIRENPFLSSASFFLFAFHQPWLTLPLEKWIFRPLFDYLKVAISLDAASAICFFTEALLLIGATLGVFAFLRHFSPSAAKILTGGR